MISALNRRLRLSGNNVILFLLFIGLVIGSCTSSRTTSKTPTATTKPADKDKHEDQVRVYDPETGTYKWVPRDMVKVDTINLKEDPSPPLVTDEDVVVDKPPVKKKQFNISLLMPFNSTSQYDVGYTDPKLDRFIQYYAGIQLAVEEVDPFGRHYVINAFDAEGEMQANDLIRREPNIAKADVIVGPYEKEGIERMAQFGLENETFVVSPWLPAFSLPGENPYFIQAVPGLGAHATAITNFIAKQMPYKKIFLVARDVPAEINRLSLFKKTPGLDMEDLIITDDSPDLQRTHLKNKFAPEGTVFILPYYAKTDEGFVNSLLRKIHSEKEAEDITVIGLPQWIGFSNLNANYMESLSVHLSISTFLDVDHPDYKSFRGRFFDRYHADPDLQAFLGYDLMKWMAATLQKGGKEAFISPGAKWNGGIASGFDIQPVFKPGDAQNVEMHTPMYYENLYIRIIQYDELDFKLIK